MVVLDNVSKRYVSKTKQKVDALRGVRFELASTGMVFILGKSGSGKSTLLNLLGGLDSPTAGEIIVDGVRMKNFKQKDYDSYRNSYVGFIFQEYNLLGDLNVKQNIELALQLSKEKDVDQTVSDAMRQVELNDEYLKRNVNELSGGEKQRVAIARCIVKESKMILADEPTGNLDSATGESIWNILKTLSRSKLVVVVSHDRESAEKYADRILEISDGEIVSDSGEQPKDERPASPFVATKKRLPFAVCLKLGLNNMKQHKVRSVFTVLLSVFSLAALLITEMCLCISPARIFGRFVKQNNVPFILVGQNHKLNMGNAILQRMNPDTMDYIEKNSDYLVNGIVENKQDVLDFGLNFAGDALELDSNSCYITEYWLHSISVGRDMRVEVNGEMVLYSEEEFSVEQLVGKRIDCFGLFTPQNDNYPTLAGVIRTEQYGTDAYILPRFFAREDFESRSILNYELSELDRIGLKFGDKNDRYTGSVFISHYCRDVTITADNVVNGEPTTAIELNDDEVVISYELFAEFFDNVKPKNEYIDLNNNKILYIPQQLGQSFELKFYDERKGEVILNAGKFTLAGVSFERYNPEASYDSLFKMVLNKKRERSLWGTIGEQSVLISMDSIRNPESFLIKLVNKYDAYIFFAGAYEETIVGNQYDIKWKVDEFVSRITEFALLFGLIGAVLLVITLLMIVNLISFSVTDRTGEIGVLMGLGTSKKDIYAIFILQTLVISVLSFVIAMSMAFGFAAITNKYYCKDYMRYVPFLCVEYITVIVAFAVSFVLVLVAAWLPLRKIAKLKPIDAIRKL